MPKVARVPEWDLVPRDEAKPRAADPHPLKYYAFLSYSHTDEATAGWLHDALERFRTPAALTGRLTANGVIPRRLTPIFRDRHELPASDNLADGIRDALDSSQFLIVLCSPAAAVSRWVNAEIDMFKRHRPDGCVLAVIVSGEPFASDIVGREAEECLPPALRQKYDRLGRPTARRAEPLAADLRSDRDGRRLGLLKLISGMLGVGLDELVQRETLRRQRRLAIVAAASLAGMAVTSTLAVVALDSRDDAREQRREAEGLVGFMLGDLRSKLEPLGRLDVLDSVGARALAYYQAQDKGSLPDESLAQRSKALTLMGEIANARGNLDTALRLYREALASTSEALKRDPDNPQRLFDHAQNVYWVGYIDWQRGRLDRAASAFRLYQRLAQRMIALQPDERPWRLEQIYADTNLGVVLFEQRRYREASNTFRNALAASETLVAAEPNNRAYQDRLLESLAWLADARENSGDLDNAMAQRERQLGLIQQLASERGADAGLKRKSMTAHRALGRLMASRGEADPGLAHAQEAASMASELMRTEPANAEWAQVGAESTLELGELQLAIDQADEAAISIRRGCDLASRLAERDRSVVEWRTGLRAKCLAARARLALSRNAPVEAGSLAARLEALARSELARGPSFDAQIAVAEAEVLRGQVADRLGDQAAANEAWNEAAAALPKNVEFKPHELSRQAMLFARLGKTSESERIAQQLAAIGYRHPSYLRDQQIKART